MKREVGRKRREKRKKYWGKKEKEKRGERIQERTNDIEMHLRILGASKIPLTQSAISFGRPHSNPISS